MKLLIEIPDSKAASFLEVLQSISFIKTKLLSEEKATLLEEIKEAVEEMNDIQKGKKEARDAEDFLNEL